MQLRQSKTPSLFRSSFYWSQADDIKAATENPKCSCGKMAAGQCDCENAAVENQSLAGQATCSCGKRAAGACTCSHVPTTTPNHEYELTNTSRLPSKMLLSMVPRVLVE